MKKIKLSEIKMGPIRQEILPNGFIDRVLKFKQILNEVETSFIEVTISNFQRDLHPERELLIWETIAEQYQCVLIEHPNWNIKDKKQAFLKLLQTSWVLNCTVKQSKV